LVDQGKNRKANPSRNDILQCYRLVMHKGVLTGKDLPDLENRRVSRICMGLLKDAVPKQIRDFPRGRGPVPSLSGIEVYNKDY